MNWIKFRSIYFIISLIFLLPGIISLLLYGLKPSIEFTGGSVLKLKISSSNVEEISQILLPFGTKEISLSQGNLTISLPPIDQSEADEVKATLKSKLETVEELSFTTIGPSIGQQLLTKALTAVLIAATLTLIYIAYSFKNITFGIFAVIAMLHDTIILLGSFSILGYLFGIEVNLLFVTAVLTTLSFSVHDTIVVFDRIRELKSRNPSSSLETLSNQAITETMARSINNSLTIIFMLLSLVLLGGDSIHNFSLALLIGAITGTYSSTFTAVPLLVTWESFANKYKKSR